MQKKKKNNNKETQNERERKGRNGEGSGSLLKQRLLKLEGSHQHTSHNPSLPAPKALRDASSPESVGAAPEHRGVRIRMEWKLRHPFQLNAKYYEGVGGGGKLSRTRTGKRFGIFRWISPEAVGRLRQLAAGSSVRTRGRGKATRDVSLAGPRRAIEPTLPPTASVLEKKKKDGGCELLLLTHNVFRDGLM